MEIDWNDWKLDKASGGRNYFESFLDADNGDARSESSGTMPHLCTARILTPPRSQVPSKVTRSDGAAQFLDIQGDLYGVSDDEEEDEERITRKMEMIRASPVRTTNLAAKSRSY